MDRHVVHALLGLLDDRVLVDLPGQLLGPAVDLLQRLVERHRADGDGGVAQHPLAGGVDVAAGGQVHDRVGAPAGRPGHLLDLLLDGGGDRGVADVGVDLHQEPLADDHRLDLRVVDVRGQYGPARGDLLAYDLGRNVLPDGHVLHLGGDLPAACVRELGHRPAVTAAARQARPSREHRVEVAQSATRRGVLDPVVLGADGTARVLLGVSAGDDPVLAQRRQSPAGRRCPTGGSVYGPEVSYSVTDCPLVRCTWRTGTRRSGREPSTYALCQPMDFPASRGCSPWSFALGRADPCLAGGRRACVLDGHETYSLRRHYPVTGSAVDAAVSVCRRFV